MRIAYLVHNLADPAVGKRVRMLTAFGDDVILIGFHRDARSIDMVEGAEALDLGRTFDANFRQRLAMIVRQCVRRGDWAARLRDCDVVIARNLEMLALAALARRRSGARAGLVYECLDIHRLLLSKRGVGSALRALERMLLRMTDLVIVSSPAFIRDYFDPVHGLSRRPSPRVLVVENKLFPAAPVEDIGAGALPGPPWRIGWFGMIRCRKSLDLLCDIASRHPGLIEVAIRGRPSRTEFADFDAQVARTPGVSFGGLYRAVELETLYRSVHFNWAIDYFEAGTNSRWLLPNRIYEGGAYDAVPIALDDTETGSWLKRLGVGVALGDAAAFEQFLLRLTPQRYDALKRASHAVPKAAFIADDRDCARLLDALGKAAPHRTPDALEAGSRPLGLGEVTAARDNAAQ